MKNRLKSIVTDALLVVLALGLSLVEQLVPLPVPVPGIKLGLANIVTLYLLIYSTPLNAAAVLYVRVALAALLFGGVTSLIYSAVGGTLALLTMLALKRLYPARLSEAGLSMAGAGAHNIGQICAAAAVLGGGAVFSYLPVLLVAAAVTGALTGTLGGLIFPRVRDAAAKARR